MLYWELTLFELPHFAAANSEHQPLIQATLEILKADKIKFLQAIRGGIATEVLEVFLCLSEDFFLPVFLNF